MRFIPVFQLVAMILCFTPVQAAYAQSMKAGFASFGKWIWGPPDSEAVRPYLESARLPHNSQWADDEWTPQAWIDSRGSATAVIEGLYEADIITGQYTDGEIPVLEVGQRFLELSGQDKRRVVAFFDDTFGITRSGPGGVLKVILDKGDVPLGLFTAKGLQLQ